MKTRSAVSIFIILLFFQNTALASPIKYDFFLIADNVDYQSTIDCGMSTSFGCSLSQGDIYRGYFIFDDLNAIQNGIVDEVEFLDFNLRIGNGAYSLGADNTYLAGFRSAFDFSQKGTGLLFENGKVVDFVGGLFGGADIPFVDLYGYVIDVRNMFSAFDGGVSIQGRVVFGNPIPEPKNLGIMLIAMSFIFLRKRKA